MTSACAWPADQAAQLRALQNPRVNIARIRRADFLPKLEMFSPHRQTRHLRWLLDLSLRLGQAIGVIKRGTGPYRYYPTEAGRAPTAAAGHLAAATIILARLVGFF